MACFANAGAAAGFVLSSGARLVTLLAMGDSGSTPAPEDEEFASFFESTLARGGRITDPGSWLSRISASGAALRFLESVEKSMPPGDASLCLTPDTCGSVPVLELDGGGPPRLVDATRAP